MPALFASSQGVVEGDDSLYLVETVLSNELLCAEQALLRCQYFQIVG